MLPDLPQRILARVEISANGCWLWTGARSSGYGKVWIDGAIVYAHRLFYERQVGSIPDGLTIDHLCRTRNCVNPAHLEPVSMLENWRRGESTSAGNARKTHCVHGHELVGDNLRVRPDGTRQCRTCRDARNAARQRRKVAA